MPTDTLRTSRITVALSLGLLLAAAALLFFAGLGRLPLIEPDEGRNAEVGREMLVTGDWVTPHYNTFAYLDKPAAYFWTVAASFRLLGVSEAAARLPSALMGLATLLLVWFLARRMFGNAAGVRAGLIFAVCPMTLVLAREVIFDMMLAFLVTAAMVAYWLAQESDFQRPLFDLLMFAAMGVAVITKGPVGILIPLGATLIYELARGRGRQWLRLRWGAGFLVFLVAALPWFVMVSLRNPDFPRYAFWNESLKRFATGASQRGGGIFYYIPVLLGGFFPWSFFLLLAGWNRLRRWKELKSDAHRPILFLLSWAAWVFCFFTISHSKLPQYFLPAIVPLSILMGMAWQEVGKDVQARPPDWLTAGFALLLGLGVLLAAASHSWLFNLYHARLVKKLPHDALELIQPSLLYTGLILASLGYLGRRLAGQVRGPRLTLATFALAAVIVPTLILRWYAPMKFYAEADSSRGLAAAMLSSPQKDLPIFGYYYYRTSLPFYLRRPVGLLSVGWGQLTSNYQIAYQAGARRDLLSKPGKGLLVTAREFLAKTKSNTQPILVLAPNYGVEGLGEMVGRIDPLWNAWDYSVWQIPPAGAAPADSGPGRVVPPFQP